MVRTENELSVRSRHGLLRDLVPIYSFYQLLPNLIALGLVLWLTLWLGHFPPIVTIVMMLAWVFQFVSRPYEMAIAKEQAAWLEAVLEAQGFYGRSDSDGRWRALGVPWWQRWPHLFIEFVPGDTVKVIAPRDVMESLRNSLELQEEHGELWFASEAQPFAFDVAEKEPEPQLPWQTKVPAAVLGAACVIAFFWTIFTSGTDGVTRWGLSASALSQRRFETILLHMFAHGGAMHLVMNMTLLAGVGPTLTARLGRHPLNWLRFVILFFLSGLSGAALYLALHPMGYVPMVGASGALYGLVGLLIRTSADGTSVLAVRSRQIRRVSWDLVKQNAFLFALLALIAWASGTAGGLAWEAHLGGFLFGLFVGPKLLPRTEATTSEGGLLSDTLMRAD
ncbi:rhomboid family intramembrane serine protease [Sphingomonas psychrotolerans]|uniref:Rhomboid family intramembrane serine protease n=1 Tax=Sphingomonas psychrotolerans TaxID=1327635 RepID=A0ABU3N0N7_9SPHN|nr:rhomboid family intramembrane serine protease [Sphingomonas psychrotolerans]MDT8758119.1 rhomboid family intramembrane serine protease [Sphingomonas psychrotolerans]